MSVCAVIIVDMKAREMFTITPEAYFIKTVPHRILSHLLMPMPSMKILCIIALALIHFYIFFIFGREEFIETCIIFSRFMLMKYHFINSPSWSSHKLRTYECASPKDLFMQILHALALINDGRLLKFIYANDLNLWRSIEPNRYTQIEL